MEVKDKIAAQSSKTESQVECGEGGVSWFRTQREGLVGVLGFKGRLSILDATRWDVNWIMKISLLSSLHWPPLMCWHALAAVYLLSLGT